ncbi:MAG: hypothetical protein L3J09_10730 [Flavobacteriaceae bacterium]|nr:hypothetical protein [Flavobacteriaceae bacterium]
MKIQKIFFYLLSIGLGFISSCSNDDDMYVNIKGKIVSQVTNEGVSDAPIFISSNEVYGSWGGGFIVVDNNSGFTDANGDFSLSLKYSNNNNIFSFYSGNEFSFTDILEPNNNLRFEEATNGELIFKVRRKAKLKITLKNINPFDENDSISFSIHQSLGFQAMVYQIDNFGVENFYIENYPLYTHWVGENVNSNIFSTLVEGATYKLRIFINKNGVQTDYFTPEFETDLANLNEYILNY